MSRLIDADKLKNHYAWWDNEDKKIFDDIVDLQPTAYDVDSVVAELESRKGYQIINNRFGESVGAIRTSSIQISDAVSIVRKGGLDE